MAEHHELVAEMPVLEQMGTQERQKLAKKRRLQQLKKWGQREKEWLAKEKHLNKRLASKLQEENNGLNLKQYTTYSSNHRSKKKLQSTASNSDLLNNNNNSSSNNNNSNNTINSRSLDHSLDGKHQVARYFSVVAATNGGPIAVNDHELAPNGRVHFNVGVMLLEAAARNDFDEVKRLLMLGVSPDSVNHDGLTALHQCCIDASEPMMNILLEFGANVDARDTEQWTPLHAACTCGHLNLVRILVENGANLLAVNGDGNMPFDICEDEATLDYIESQMVNRGITQEMIDFTRASTEIQMISDLERQLADGLDLNAANEQGVTQLHIAAANGYLSAVKFLLKHDVNVNACDNDLWRPLHGAACWGNEQHVKVVELLVEAGAQLDAKTINDETVFDLCDNAVLLERLNQLKDEIESKQALDSDKLRRIQSRTNSRVHSVRRTSVRDKNQISRREAREEALLRVDNSPSATRAPVSDAVAISNGQSALDNNIVVQDTKQSQANNPTSEKQTNLTNGQVSSEKSEVVSSVDCVDSHSKSRIDLSNENDVPSKVQVPKQTDLDNEDPTEDAVNSSESIKFSDEQNKVSKTADNKESQQLQNDGDTCDGYDDDNGEKVRDQDLQPNYQQDQQQQSPMQAHMVPINYTLSNLKKQRSDLRMRTTSIGGNNNSTSSINQPKSKQQKVVLDPRATQATGSLLSNGLHHRPESPSLTFRKFRGEPSEVIGGAERNDRRKCCILI